MRLDAESVARLAPDAVHIVTRSSLAEHDAALRRRGVAAIDVARLRPNVVLGEAGSPRLPFIEEHVARLVWRTSGQTQGIAIEGPCVRCIVPNVDLLTAHVGDEPLRTMSDLSAERHPGAPSRSPSTAAPSGRACWPKATSSPRR